MKDTKKRIVAAIVFITLLLNVASIEYFAVYEAKRWNRVGQTNQIEIYSSTLKGSELIEIFQTFDYYGVEEFKFSYKDPDTYDANDQNNVTTVNSSDEYSIEFGSKDNIEIYVASIDDWASNYITLYFKKSYTIETEPTDQRQPATVNELSNKNIGEFDTESEFDVALKSMITASWSNSEDSGSVDPQSINVSLALTNKTKNEFGETVKYYSVTVTVSEGQNWLATEQATVFEDVYWTVNQYSISFNTDGGTAISPIKQDYGTNITPPTTPTKYGYTFVGWDRELPATMPAENIVITAKWAVATKNVSFDPNDGVWPDGTTGIKTEKLDLDYNLDEYIAPKRRGYDFLGWEKQDTAVQGADESYEAIWNIGKTVTFKDGDIAFAYNYAVGETITPPTLVEKVGYSFAGWDLVGQNGVGDGMADAVTTMGNESVTYVAIWTPNMYTVTFYRIDDELYESVTKFYGESYSITSEPTLMGHTFVGWDLKVDGKYDNEPDDVSWIIGAENLEYREIIKINQYTITFDTEGGSPIEPITLNYGASVTPPKHPIKIGCEFDGWDINIPQTMPAKDYTITARWTTNNYTITFDTDGGTTIAPITQKYGDAVTFPDPPTKAYHTFAGWDKEIPTTMPAENITIKALWNENNYTITFDTDGGSEIDSITQAYGTEIAKPGNPEKEGYVFVGWDKEIPSTMPAENITITAIWKEAIKVVSFDPNGGVWADNTNEIKTEKLEFDYNAEKYIAPTKRGYDFGGWIKKDVAVSGADESYEAIWNLGKTVSFKDGDAVYEDNYAVGETVTAPALGEKIGHTFVGWDLVEENGVGDGSKDAVISIMGNESITYVAIWEKNKYTVTFYHENGDVYEAHTKYYGESFSISNEPSKTGYTFIGWDLIVDDICDKEPDTVSWIMGAQNLEYKEIFKINQYTITFNTSGGSEIAPITQNFDSEITLPSHPTKIGCEFVGWNMDIPTKMPAKDITITAIWNANSYTITFDTDGGSYIAPIVQKYGEAVSIPNEPSKIGHTFAGWDLIIADGKGDGEKDEIVDTMGDSNISYVALWSVNSYKINWTVDGQDYVKTDVVYGESIVVPATPVKMGYTFGGWNVPDTMPAEDITLNAVWIINQYTISFITNGDTEIPAITKNYGETIVIPEDPIKTGYTFAGWDVEIPATMPAENITISAQWTINSYKVIWNPNGGIWSDGTTGSKTVSYKYGEEIQIPDELTKAGFNLVWNEIDATMGATDVEYVAKWSEGDTVTFNDGVNTVTKPYAVGETIDQPENPSKIGHRFIGWDANGDNKKDNVIKTMGEESIVYVALWEKMQYTVTFYCENGDVYEAHTKYYGEAFSITNEPSKLGYTFVGWDLKVNGKYDNEPDTVTWVMGTENLEYREIFRINQYTITFDTVGGSIIEPITLNYGTTITPPAHPTKVGCEFDGWDIIIPQTMPAKDYTITARWTTNNYTITFDTDGGTTIAPITQKYGDAVTFPDNPTKAYHTFAGWDKEIPTTMPAENVTIKALWNVNNYTLTFDTDGGSEIDSITQAYGTEITKPINPEKEGYLFVGWDKEIPSTMPAENISITAKWEEATKRVSFDPNGGKWNDGSTLMKTEVLKISDDTHSYPAPTKKGYNFGGWQKQESAIPSSDESYVANWIPGKTVVFKDGDIVYEDNYAFCETVTAPVLAEKVGYTFVGWDLVGLNGVGDGFKDQVISVMGNESLVYVAIWQANEYTVYFYDENDELIEAITAKYGAPFGISITPTKTGHTFVGWDLKKDGKFDGIVDAVSATMGAENLEYREIFRINQYTITFNTNGGSEVAPITQNYGTEIKLPAHPTKVGCEFDGWDINIPQIMPARDYTITARWKTNSYTITFDTDGGSEIAPIIYKYGEVVSISSVPSKIGYTFAGWDKEIPETMPAEDLTLTAKWTVNQYTITFDTDGGSMVDPITRNYGEAIKVPNDPTKSYHTFAGWDKEIPATMPAENITIKALWNENNYTITFDTDGGSEIDSITQAYGTEITKPINPEKEGYLFVGWDKEIPSIMPAENITITARWEEAVKIISFDPNGGVWADNTNEIKTEKLNLDYNAEKYIAPTKRGFDFGGWIKKDVAVSGADESYEAIWNLGKTVTFKDGDAVYEDNYAFGETVTAPVLAEKVGYTFVGWDLVGLNGVGDGFKDQVISVMGNESLVYVAIWQANEYTVYFYDENDELIEAITAKYGAPFGISIIPTKTGHTFVGWDLKKDGKYDGIVDAVSATMGAENLEYREIFRINRYTITFDTNGGSTIEPITLNYGEKVTPPVHPTKVGYEFDGWDINIPQTMPAKDSTITALWKSNSYKIMFDTDGGSEIAPIVFKYGEAVSVSSVPSRIGYIFAGWDKEIPETMPAEDLMLTAKWTINQYTITFDTDGGSMIDPITRNYGEAIKVPNDPTKSYYTFAGWDKEIPATMPAENITIKASWNVNNYTITFDTDGGSEIDSITQAYGTEIAKPNNPEKEGYVFVGWDKEIPSTMPAENITITAIWNEAIKVVSFDPNGGVWADNTNEIKTEKLELDYNAEKYIAPTKRGYDFDGWIKKDVAVSGADESYEAIWNLGKTVTFKDGDTVYEDNYAFGETVTAPVLAEKVGYTFVGWDLVGLNGVGNGFKDQVVSVMGNESLVYVAIWQANEYTVYFYNENDELIEAITAKYGAPFGISITPTKTGHTFVGWDLKKDGKYDSIADAVSPTMGAEDLEYREIFAIGQYTITFDSDGGSAVAPITQSYGTDIVVPADPTKEGYKFAGWDKGVPLTMPALNITLTARWEKAKYSISWDMNADGVIDDYDIVTTVEHGDIPVLPEAEVPVKESTAEFSYVFTNSWLPAIKPAEGDATYTAQYDIVLRKYTVKFLNYDGTSLQTSEVEYGATPVYCGETPIKIDDKQYDYTFAGWSPTVESVTKDAVYTATFTESIKKYTVVWKNWDGSVLETDHAVEHGDFPKYNGKTPTKPATEAVNYVFEGWEPQISGLTGDVTYTATFTEKVKTYSITWLAEDGSIIDVTVVEYGKIPAYAAPMKPSTAEYSYAFAGWNPSPVAVSGDATYTASYTATKNKYTVTWNVDGTKTSESYEYGVLPTFKGSSDKAADGCTAYSFTGWNKKVSEVVGNVEYIATYSTATVHISTEFVYESNHNNTHSKKYECCKSVVETVACADAMNDGNHKCDFCGADSIGTHIGGKASCKTLAKCDECGSTYGSYDANNHESNQIRYSDITKTTHDEIYACCNAIKADNAAHNYVDKNCTCGAKKIVTVVIMNGESVWETIESEDDAEVSVSDMPVPTPTPGYVFSGWYTEDGVRVDSETDLTDDMVLHAGYFSGDVDGDGTIEKDDVGKLTRYIVGQDVETVEDEKAFDINGDGDVTVVDSILLLLHISGKRPMTP